MVSCYDNQKPIYYNCVAKGSVEGEYIVSDGLINKRVILENNKKELFLPCSCGSEIVRIEQYLDEEEVYLSVYRYHSVSYSFFARLKMCVNVLLGKGISTADVVLSKENFNKLKEF